VDEVLRVLWVWGFVFWGFWGLGFWWMGFLGFGVFKLLKEFTFILLVLKIKQKSTRNYKLVRKYLYCQLILKKY
jgi:hypothetical protein